MRIGIVGVLHESNTFVREPTTLDNFSSETLLRGDEIVERFAEAHHELGGFIAELHDRSGDGVQCAPIFAARAIPSGTISAAAFDGLLERMLSALDEAGPLDGLLVAPHGATVSEQWPDADGRWLQLVRQRLGDATPIVGTIDPHANLSPTMVQQCNALIAYRTNPHLDQRDRGREAAKLLIRTCQGEVRPKMAALLPPMAINIEKQCTSEPHLKPLYELADQQLSAATLSNSVVLGFPYADVAEMGCGVIAIANDASQAELDARHLAARMWSDRERYAGRFTSVAEAVAQCAAEADSAAHRVCLLDMGDNVGGGSPGDGTLIMEELLRRNVRKSFVCLCDPEAAAACAAHGAGREIQLTVGGKTDRLHGAPLAITGRVVSLHEGRFTEAEPRHGGIGRFDQGATALVETEGLTVMLTTKRAAPFSLQQLKSCGLDPASFNVLVAKGVNAPIAAYREVCDTFIRVNTPGSTCADMMQLPYQHRRRPMFPFEEQTDWSAERANVIWGCPSGD